MAILQWNKPSLADPFEELDRLQEEMNRLFGLTYRPDSTGIFDQATAPAIDLVEGSERFTLLVDLPGLGKSDVELTVAPRVLTLRGEKKASEKDAKKMGKARTFRDETWEGSFQRTISLPEAADTDKISAELSDGVLRVDIPKRAELKPRQIPVAVKG